MPVGLRDRLLFSSKGQSYAGKTLFGVPVHVKDSSVVSLGEVELLRVKMSSIEHIKLNFISAANVSDVFYFHSTSSYRKNEKEREVMNHRKINRTTYFIIMLKMDLDCYTQLSFYIQKQCSLPFGLEGHSNP